MARHVDVGRKLSCGFCHAPITRGTNQAQRRFCNAAHREAAYRRRRVGLPEDWPAVHDLARAARAYQREQRERSLDRQRPRDGRRYA